MASSPSKPQLVPGDDSAAARWIADRRGPVANGDVVHVGEAPVLRRQLHGEWAFLAANAVALIETSNGEKRAASYDCGARNEAQHGRARQVGIVWQRAVRHLRAGRVQQLFVTDEHATGHQRQSWVRVPD